MQKTGRAGLSRLTARKNRVGYLFLLPFMFGSFVIFYPRPDRIALLFLFDGGDPL